MLQSAGAYVQSSGGYVQSAGAYVPISRMLCYNQQEIMYNLQEVMTDSFIHRLVNISLRRRHPQTVLLVKTNYIDSFSEILDLEGHLNRCIDSKVTAILLNWWILPTGGVASGRVCPAACAAGLFF